jgi:hypothetical protein
MNAIRASLMGLSPREGEDGALTVNILFSALKVGVKNRIDPSFKHAIFNLSTEMYIHVPTLEAGLGASRLGPHSPVCINHTHTTLSMACFSFFKLEQELKATGTAIWLQNPSISFHFFLLVFFFIAVLPTPNSIDFLKIKLLLLRLYEGLVLMKQLWPLF